MLADDGCGAPRVPNAGTVSSFLDQYPPPVPGGGCRRRRLDYPNVEPKGKVEQRVGWDPLV